jgi:pimeloyl-ACP methyl ester carboxylesterase
VPPVEPEPIIGRYYRIPLGEPGQSDSARVFVEQAGSGVPLLCLHTAGADSRQYRHLMADPEVTARFRVIAFDLPWHGRSSPPGEWWRSEYRLTTERYAQTIRAVIDALDLDRPVLLGCSMGGSAVLELARTDGHRLRGVISLSGAGKLTGRFADWSLHPDVNAQQAVASWTYGLMAPQGPEADRREVWWIYSQGGPGVYRGDTWFYSEDFDLRGQEAEIDTVRCPVHMLTGSYDYACAPADSASTAAAIPGAEFTEMPGIGHFPMSENYPLFRTHLLPVLERVLAPSAAR